MSNEEIGQVITDYLTEDQVAPALKYARGYVETHPYEVAGWYWLGISFLFLKKHQFAMQAFGKGASLNIEDTDILFGLGVIHSAVSNYWQGREYFQRFQKKYPYGVEDQEIIGRAIMLLCGKAYIPALLFLEFMNSQKPAPSTEINTYTKTIYWECVEYALVKTASLKDRQLMLANISPENTPAMQELVRKLLAELSWGDAIHLYTKYLGPQCQKCPRNGSRFACLRCISKELLPPTSLLRGVFK